MVTSQASRVNLLRAISAIHEATSEVASASSCQMRSGVWIYNGSDEEMKKGGGDEGKREKGAKETDMRQGEDWGRVIDQPFAGGRRTLKYLELSIGSMLVARDKSINPRLCT